MTAINIVFEHPDFIVIDKPPGIAVQDEAHASGILPLLCQQTGLAKLYLVHRLDKVTSGLLILAKSHTAAAEFGKLFSGRKIEKYYLALGSKKPKHKQGSVIGDMKKIRDGKWILSKEKTNPAVSQFFSLGMGDGHRLFLLKPYSGKTHQLRVAMKSLGSPILGDTSYTAAESDRTYLHAFALRFSYQQQDIELLLPPCQGEHFSTADFARLLTSYMTPWTLAWPKLSPAILTLREAKDSPYEPDQK
jgi:tRNA pseudouridine32 synthase/23S rRNA pseudouridine746 synthase